MDLVDWEVHAISHQAFKCNVIQSTSDEAAGRLAYVAQHLDAHHSLLRFLFHINSSSCHFRIHRPLCSTHTLCLTDSACSSSMVTSPCPVDHGMKPERIRTGLTPSLTGGSRTRTRVPTEEGRPLIWALYADTVAGEGGPLNWSPSAHAVAGAEALRMRGAPQTPGARVARRCTSIHGTPHCARRDCHAVLRQGRRPHPL